MNNWDLPGNIRMKGDILVIGPPGSGYESLKKEFEPMIKKMGWKARFLGDCGFRAAHLFPHQWTVDCNKLFYEMTSPHKRGTVWFGYADNLEMLFLMPWAHVLLLDLHVETLIQNINSYRAEGPIPAQPLLEIDNELLWCMGRLQQCAAYFGSWARKWHLTKIKDGTSTKEIYRNLAKAMRASKPEMLYPSEVVFAKTLLDDPAFGMFRTLVLTNPETGERREVFSVAKYHFVMKYWIDGSSTLKFGDASLDAMLSSWNTTEVRDSTPDYMSLGEAVFMALTCLKSYVQDINESQGTATPTVWEYRKKSENWFTSLGGEGQPWRVKLGSNDTDGTWSFKMATSPRGSDDISPRVLYGDDEFYVGQYSGRIAAKQNPAIKKALKYLEDFSKYLDNHLSD